MSRIVHIRPRGPGATAEPVHTFRGYKMSNRGQTIFVESLDDAATQLERGWALWMRGHGAVEAPFQAAQLRVRVTEL